MRALVREGAADPLVRDHARAIAAAHPHLHPVEAVFAHTQSLPYEYDEAILARMGDDGGTSELLQGASLQVARELALGRGAVPGDCDDRALYLNAHLEALGYPTGFLLVRGPGRRDFSHVYSAVRGEAGWVPLDPIFNGEGGRPRFRAGEEVGALEGARDRTLVPVADGGSGALLALALLAAIGLWRR